MENRICNLCAIDIVHTKKLFETIGVEVCISYNKDKTFPWTIQLTDNINNYQVYGIKLEETMSRALIQFRDDQ